MPQPAMHEFVQDGAVTAAPSRGSNQFEPASHVTELDGVPYGATCDSDQDCGDESASCCAGGKCSAEGWCSPKCESDNDCPESFFCIDHSGSRCFSACEDDRDCPVDFICEEKSGHRTCRFK